MKVYSDAAVTATIHATIKNCRDRLLLHERLGAAKQLCSVGLAAHGRFDLTCPSGENEPAGSPPRSLALAKSG